MVTFSLVIVKSTVCSYLHTSVLNIVVVLMMFVKKGNVCKHLLLRNLSTDETQT